MSQYEIMPGTPGLQLDDATNLLIPGRGRGPNGEGLSTQSAARVNHAATVYQEQNFALRGGIIVCSGYKTPADQTGDVWSPEDALSETYVGVPEAYSMRQELLVRGIEATAIHVEANSIDTVTNFVNAEGQGHFTDGPVAIVAQEAHLERMMKYIAPKTLRRDYLGIIVPEQGEPDKDGLMPQLVSRYILHGMDTRTPDIAHITHTRAARVWAGVTMARRMIGRGDTYKTDVAQDS